jgi:hypothetical protein
MIPNCSLYGSSSKKEVLPFGMERGESIDIRVALASSAIRIMSLSDFTREVLA